VLKVGGLDLNTCLKNVVVSKMWLAQKGGCLKKVVEAIMG